MIFNLEGGVRPDWMFELAHVCQRFVGDALEADIDQFAALISRLQGSLPEARSPLERLIGRDRMIACATRSAETVHDRYHHQFPARPCAGCPVHETARSISAFNYGPAERLSAWASEFSDTFRRTHQAPTVDQAAAILRRAFDGDLDLAALPRELGCGRTRLLRDFRTAFGASMREYWTRVRLRHAAQALREPGSKVDAVAHSVGYRSPKNFNRALMVATALTPSDIRSMATTDFEHLLSAQLPLHTRRPDAYRP